MAVAGGAIGKRMLRGWQKPGAGREVRKGRQGGWIGRRGWIGGDSNRQGGDREGGDWKGTTGTGSNTEGETGGGQQGGGDGEEQWGGGKEVRMGIGRLWEGAKRRGEEGARGGGFHRWI